MENPDKDETMAPSKEKELNDLKGGMAHKSEKDTGLKKINSGGIAITFVLIVMIAIAAIQTVELVNILNKINKGNFNQTGSSGSNNSSESGVEGLPDMVGGC